MEAQLESVLRAIEVLPFEQPADVVYGALRARLEEIGQPIGANDLLLPLMRWRCIARSSPTTNASSRASRRLRSRTGCVDAAGPTSRGYLIASTTSNRARSAIVCGGDLHHEFAMKELVSRDLRVHPRKNRTGSSDRPLRAWTLT